MTNPQITEELKLKILKTIDSYIYPVGVGNIVNGIGIVRRNVIEALKELKAEGLVKHGILFHDRVKYKLSSKGREQLRGLR